MDQNNTIYYFSIPFSEIPVYQLLSQKHELTMHGLKFEKNSRILRIHFTLQGSAKDVKSFYKDLDRIEMYEDKLKEIFHN